MLGLLLLIILILCVIGVPSLINMANTPKGTLKEDAKHIEDYNQWVIEIHLYKDKLYYYQIFNMEDYDPETNTRCESDTLNPTEVGVFESINEALIHARNHLLMSTLNPN